MAEMRKVRMPVVALVSLVFFVFGLGLFSLEGNRLRVKDHEGFVIVSAEETMVTTANLNLRSGPGTGYSIITVMPKGTAVVVTGYSGTWAMVRYGNYSGYAVAAYLSNATQSISVQFTTANLNLRSGPGTSYSILAVMPKGSEVSVISTSNGWSKVTYSGKTGYASSAYLTNAPLSPTSLGVKYTTANLNLRTGPSTSYSIILTIPKGEMVEVTDTSKAWPKVRYGEKEGYASPTYLSDNPPAVVTDKPKAYLIFTFDDGAKDIIDVAAPILYAKGLKATAYVMKNKTSQYWATTGMANDADFEKLYSYYGWDLSNHTVNHMNLNNTSLQVAKQEYLDNQNWLISKGWTRGAHHAAYPGGLFNDQLVAIMQEIGAKTGRTIVDGLEPTAVTDPYRLNSVSIMQDISVVKAQIDNAVNSGKTIILIAHGVNDTPERYVLSTSVFQEIVDYASAKENLTIATISEWYNANR